MSNAQPLIGITTYRTSASSPPGLPVLALSHFYSQGVAAGGGAPIQIPLGLDATALRTIFDRLDGLLLSGGGDVDPAYYGEQTGAKTSGIDRDRDELEFALTRWAMESGKPVLAVCRGHQVLNVALGGSLYQDVLDEMPGAIRHAFFQSAGYERQYRAHTVDLTPACRMAEIMGGTHFLVNSLHHQGIKTLAPGLTPVGTAPDGLIEAYEVQDHPFAISVQWHPEALAPEDPAMQRLFDALVEAASDEHRRRI